MFICFKWLRFANESLRHFGEADSHEPRQTYQTRNKSFFNHFSQGESERRKMKVLSSKSLLCVWVVDKRGRKKIKMCAFECRHTFSSGYGSSEYWRQTRGPSERKKTGKLSERNELMASFPLHQGDAEV